MLDDNTPVTPEIKAAIISQLKHFRDETKMPLSEIATSIGQAESVLSQVMRGTYNGDTDGIIRKLDKWLTEEAPNKIAAAQRRQTRGQKFVMTAVAEELFDYASAAKRKGIMVYFAAPAGVGKTMALEAIYQQTIGAVYVCCRTKVDSAQAFFRQLADAIGVDSRGTYQQIFGRLVARLKYSNRLLLVDQVHKLIDRRKDEALLALGDLHDETECPMLLVGTRGVLSYLEEHVGRDPIEQLDSRIKLRRDLTQRFLNSQGGRHGGKPIYSTAKIIELMHRRQLRLGPGAPQSLAKIANGKRGHLRIVDAVLDAIGLKFGDKDCHIVDTITVEQIEDVIPQVLGRVDPTLLQDYEAPAPMAAAG